MEAQASSRQISLGGCSQISRGFVGVPDFPMSHQEPAMRHVLQAKRWITSFLVGSLLAACGYDDTPNAMRVIDGETDRLLYARMVIDAADAVTAGAVPDTAAMEQVADAYVMSQQAYIAVLECEDDGVCRRASLGAACDDVSRLIAARRVLAPYSDPLGVYEAIAGGVPFDADRLRVLVAEARRDGEISAFEQDVVLLASAVAGFEELRMATPAGAREAKRRREQRAVDEFAQRCAAR